MFIETRGGGSDAASKKRMRRNMVEASDTHRFAPELNENFIVDRIYAAVMEQRLAPKTKLSESKLCESFGVGRMRVRRALLLLADQGIVNLQSNRGAFIACPEPREAHEVFEARMLIEPGLIRSVAENITPSDLAYLKEHIAMEDVARNGSERTKIIRLSGEYHVKLAKVSGNAVLTKIIRELVTRTSLIVGLFGDADNSSCPDDEHANILKAIEAGDANLAENLCRRHLSHIQVGLDLSPAKSIQTDLTKILGMN
jgi:DNA-binding GntR family transcriptional regulator